MVNRRTVSIELIILAAVAVFVISRLYSVLGQRTGSEPAPRRRPTVAPASVSTPREREEVERPSQRAAFTGPAAAGLELIATADPDFTPEDFTSGARRAYEIIVAAYADGNKERLRPLLDDDVYDAFSEGIDQRKEEGAEPMRLLRFRTGRISEASVDADGFARIRVRFEADLSDGENMRKAREIWTFKRPTQNGENPNWLLDEVTPES
jgi:predicted lipid-binding transport protein (Tim44 family)